jgi:hypothetical protein
MRTMLLSVIVGCSLANGLLVDATRAVAAEKSAPVLKHVVMYKFRDDLTPAQVQSVIEAFKSMAKKVETVVALEYGLNSSREGKSDGLPHCFVVTFKDEAGRDAYLVHPAHAEYVKFAKDKRDKVIVFDYQTQE